MDNLSRLEQDSQLRNVSPAKFSLLLLRVDNAWTSREIRGFFEKELNGKIRDRAKQAEKQGKKVSDV